MTNCERNILKAFLDYPIPRELANTVDKDLFCDYLAGLVDTFLSKGTIDGAAFQDIVSTKDKVFDYSKIKDTLLEGYYGFITLVISILKNYC